MIGMIATKIPKFPPLVRKLRRGSGRRRRNDNNQPKIEPEMGKEVEMDVLGKY
jgi:hypothetical protein